MSARWWACVIGCWFVGTVVGVVVSATLIPGDNLQFIFGMGCGAAGVIGGSSLATRRGW